MKRIFLRGFTLIELLIVITIIGILAVALLPSVLGAPARARDAARKADLNNIIAAIETYNSDNQKYPPGGGCIDNIDNGKLKDYFQGKQAPKDPQGKGPGALCTTGYVYCQFDGNPASYAIASNMEMEGDANTTYAGTLNTKNCNGADADIVEPYAMKTEGDHIYLIAK